MMVNREERMGGEGVELGTKMRGSKIPGKNGIA